MRNPNFSRPWQFVLEPLKGYLILAKKQFSQPIKFSGSWNFGTQSNSSIKVIEIVKLIIKFWGNGQIKFLNKKKFKEQKNLQIDSFKAKMKLKWKTSYSTKKAVSATSEWYSKVFRDKIRPVDVTIQQIEEYMKKS